MKLWRIASSTLISATLATPAFANDNAQQSADVTRGAQQAQGDKSQHAGKMRRKNPSASAGASSSRSSAPPVSSPERAAEPRSDGSPGATGK